MRAGLRFGYRCLRGGWKETELRYVAWAFLLAACAGQSCQVSPVVIPDSTPDENVLGYKSDEPPDEGTLPGSPETPSGPDPVPDDSGPASGGLEPSPSEPDPADPPDPAQLPDDLPPMEEWVLEIHASRAEGDAPLSVEFSAATLDGRPLPDGVKCEWDFGDGEKGTGSSVMHTYTRAAIYTVTLCASVSGGLISAPGCSRKDVNVRARPANSRPVAHPVSVVTTVNTPKTIALRADAPSGQALTFFIDSAAGPQKGGLVNLKHVSFSTAEITYLPHVNVIGDDSFQYYVSNGDLESPPSTVSITINPPEVANVTVDAGDDAAAIGTAAMVNLTGIVTSDSGTPLTSSWSVASGPGTVRLNDAASLTTTATFDGVGTYVLKLTVLSFGVEVGSDTVTVHVLPAMTIQGDPSSGTAPLSVTLTATETGGSPLSNLPTGSVLHWDFADGTAAGTGNPVSHTFELSRTYTVALSAALPGGPTVKVAEAAISVYPGSGNLDADGWTVIRASADTRIVYVSSSAGNDANSGLAMDEPVKTISKGYSLLRDGYPDHLLLKRGDTFNDVWNWSWNKSGHSSGKPILISAYGAGVRPVFASGTYYGLQSDGNPPSNNVAIIGLDFYCNGRDPAIAGYSTNNSTGLRWLASTVHGENLLVEDCRFRFYGSNATIQGYNGGSWKNVSFRRNVLVDAWNLESVAHSQGAFFSFVDGLLLEENVFDHNGWNESIAGASPTVFNHNVYITSACSAVVIRGNIFANASSHGIQVRSGGKVTGNLFINNPIGMSYGLVNGGSSLVAGGVSGVISGNVFLGGRDIAGSPRGWSIEMANLRAAADGGGTTVRENVFANAAPAASAAIILSICDGKQPNFSQSPGLNDLTIEGNVVYNWYRALILDSRLVPGGTGPQSLNGLVVQNNDFQQLTATAYSAVMHEPAFSGQYEQFSGNRYSPALFFLAGTGQTLPQWQAEVEATAQDLQVVYPDSTRDLAHYSASIGGPPTSHAFLAPSRQLSAQNWDARFTAEAAINYIRQGFGKPALPE